MPPKRVKSGTGSGAAAAIGNRTWESGLVAAPFEEDTWKANISLVVGARPEDEENIKALALAVNQPARRLFCVVTWDSTLEKIHELGNPKAKKSKEVPMFYEQRRSWMQGRLPPHLLGKVVKFQLLAAKTHDLQRRVAEQRPAEDKVKGKARASSPSKEKGGAAAKPAGKGEKGKKTSDPPAPAKDTKLKRRGEGEETSKYIDDEPAEGPQLYVLMVGFHQPQLVAVLDMLGVRVSSVIRVSSESPSESTKGQDELESCRGIENAQDESTQGGTATPQEQAAESEAVKSEVQLARFWRYLDPVLHSGPAGSRLWDVVRLQYTLPKEVPDLNRDNTTAMLERGMLMFDGVASLIYDCLDWRRQHLHYLSSLRLIQVPAVTRGNTLSRQQSPAQASVKADPQTSPSRRKPVPEEPTAVAPPVLTTEVDMRYYRDLLDLIPSEAVSVPLILHCMKEQVVATQEQIPPLSEVEPDPRADGLDQSLADHMITAALSLGLSEEENEKLMDSFGVEKCNQKKKESQRPLLYNYHDERSMRLQQLPVQYGLDPVQVEVEMLRSSLIWRSLHSAHPQSESRRRLARLQELLHFCTDESLSWAEVEWAFRQFVFESMHLTQVDGRGLLMGVEPQDPPLIPWDDPSSFIQHIRRQTAQDRGDEDNKEFCGNDEGESKVNQEKPSGVEIKEIQRTRIRSLRDWHLAEHHDPDVFLQVLQNAFENYICVDTLHSARDNVVFVVCHNPMSPQRQNSEHWDMALHTDVGFRKYLEHVAESISDWTNQEEAKKQALLEEREAERLNAPTPSEHSESPRKRSRSSPRRSAGKRAGTASPLKSPCPEDPPARELHIRQDSLKAWKIEQDRLKEEELTKKSKKEKEGKVGLKGGERSQSSRASKKTPSATRRKREEALKSPESAAPPEDRRTELQPPEDEARGFTGYSMGGDLIQVWGHAQSLFPSDGGHIRVESTHFIQGSTLVKVCVMKDKHHFFIHVTEPKRDSEEKEDGVTIRDKELGLNKRTVSKFGSFSALLENGIRLSYSHHGPSGESPDERDSTLASVLDIRPPSSPSPAPSSSTSPSPSGKRLKSSHSSKGSRTKGNTPPPLPTEKGGAREGEVQMTPHCNQGKKEKSSSAALPDLPPPKRLNVSTPNGLFVQFLCAQEPAVKGDDEVAMVRQSFPALTHSTAGKTELPLSLELSRVITSQGTVIKHMRDGSMEVLFADGTVSNSPDFAPVCKPPCNPPIQEVEPVRGQRSGGKDPAEKKGKLSSKPGIVAVMTAKTEGVELSDSGLTAEQGGAEQGVASQPQECTWVTTTQSGLRVATTGVRVIHAQPIQACKATDPLTGTVMITREDRVLTVLEEGGTAIVEHADGTRITTFYQETEVPLSQVHLETGEVLIVSRKDKMVRVECVGFAPVVINCAEGTCSTEFGEETVITACPNGSYQVFPPAGGLLCIGEDGTATYTSHPSHSAEQTSTGTNSELQPANYVMRHTADIICEVVDPEGNLFQVMVDGEISAVVSNFEDYLVGEEYDEEELEEEEGDDAEWAERWKFQCIRYTEHSPRFFVVHEDGSGTELLRYCDVEDFLSNAHSDPSIAVLREPIPELPGVSGITVLRPCAEDIWSHWLIPKQSDDIIPTNLRSRRWDTFPFTEKKIPGPPFGTTLGKGLYLKERHVPRPVVPVLTCPEVLQVRQLIQYQPISSRLRRNLERRLQRYLEHLLERELLLEEMQVKDPRTEEERVHATDLLQLVLSLPDSDSAADTLQRRLSTDSVAPSKGSEVDLDTDRRSVEKQESLWARRIEQHRQELQEGEACRLALRNRIIPPYFSSDIGKAFSLTEEVPDMESLSQELPPFPKQRDNPNIQEFHREAAEPAALRPANPTPSQAAGGDSSQGRPTNPTPQAAAPPCFPSASGNSPTQHPQTQQDQPPSAPAPCDPSFDQRPQVHTYVAHDPLEQREGGSGHRGSGCRSSALDVAGNPRREGLRLPSAILSAKPSSLPNQRFLSVEEPVRRKVRTVSVMRSQSGGLLPTPPRGSSSSQPRWTLEF
ncbi:hypothetical protein AGOR_G00217380 [Albula goreensis]|uniref:Sperm-associated antigen 17 n=1 Tax=Albula goreensis TaxID=1534307 RepID=A0A8T3CR05_9TELE|nr:hypothetical protein AGOR_G00217380 [Albula goreensis]